MSEALTLKEEGLERVEMNNQDWIDLVRKEARNIIRSKGYCSTDEIHEYAELNGLFPKHHDAYGAVFRGDEFIMLDHIQSKRPSGHGRWIKRFGLKNYWRF